MDGESVPEWAMMKGIKDYIEEDISPRYLGYFNHPHVRVETNRPGLSIHFTVPKRVEEWDKLSPADVYYNVRIHEYPDEWFLFQWFACGFATPEHFQRYYQKYPHFGPGGSRHTFISQITGKEELCYQPAVYKDHKSMFLSNANSQGWSYVCDGSDSLIRLIRDFDRFLDGPDVLFRPDYPNLK